MAACSSVKREDRFEIASRESVDKLTFDIGYAPTGSLAACWIEVHWSVKETGGCKIYRPRGLA